LFAVIVLAVMLTAFGGLSFAQETEEAEQPAVEEEAVSLPTTVGEITVTARKVEEDIQDVPVSISTLAGEDLQVLTTGGVDVRMLSGRVPSLVMESSFGRAFPRFYIRGLGNSDFDLNASQPVSMVVDEVVLENPVVKGIPLFDLDRVEVLRGPQGTLFGRNTPAGVVKFETVKPSQEFDAYVRASYGTYSTTDVQAAVGGSLGGDWSGRISALHQSRSDWVDNNYEPGPEDEIGGYTTTAYRAQLLWEPGERFSALLNIHGWDVSDATARIFRGNMFVPGTNNIVPGFQQDEVWLDGVNDQEINSYGGLLRLEYDFGAATLVSLTGYETLDMFSRGDIDGGSPEGPGFIAFPAESADGLPYLDQWTQEIRIASSGNQTVNWLVGAFWFSEEYQVDSFNYNSGLPGNPQDGYSFQVVDSTAYALFGSVDWRLSDSWNLTAGLRYSNDEKDFSAERPWPVFQTPTSEPITEFIEADDVSWDLSATYKVNQDFNVYGRVATSYRAPSIQGRIAFCADFEFGQNPATNCVTMADTETIISGEIGIKTILAENSLRFNLTGYVFEMDDQQISAVGGEFNTATLLNADKTEGYGLEADIQWTPTAHWLTTFGFSWNPTKMNDPDLTVVPCGGGCTITDPIIDGNVYVDGNSLPHAPDVIFNGIINYRSDAVNKGLFGTLDWAYYSEKSFFLYESEEFKGDSLEFGLRLGYGWNQGRYEVALFGRNITDEVIARGGIDFLNITGFTNDPRIIGIEFFARF
jgi:iron complex outermembrane receptor protein